MLKQQVRHTQTFHLSRLCWLRMLLLSGFSSGFYHTAIAEERLILEPMTIRAEPLEPPASTYLIPYAGAATKTDTPIMEIPYSVKVVPQQVIQDQQAIRIDQLVQNISSIQRSVANAGLSDQLTVRGFASIPFRDGFRFEDQNANGRRDMANIERVEVLKGPGSILYGQAEPGGIINLVTKKPLSKAFHQIEHQFGSFDFHRTRIDTTGPLTKAVSYRVNLAYENAGSFRNLVENERFFVAPVLRWDIDAQTQLNLELDYLHGQTTPDNGIPADGNRALDVSRERYFGEPFNQAKFTDFVLGLNWSHAFNDQWTIRQRFNIELVQSEITNVTTRFSEPLLSEDRGSALRQLEILRDARNQSYYTAINLDGQFNTWGLEHHVLLGADYYREDTRWGFVEDDEDELEFDAFDFNNPRYQRGAAPNSFTANDLPGDDIDESEDWFGFYFQNQLTLPYHFHLLAGLRYDNIASSGIEKGERFDEPRQDAITPRAGLLWRPIPSLSLYGSYSENFSGSNGLSRSGGKLPPESAQQWEVGLKTELWDGRLFGSLAWYDLTKQNIGVPDPVNPLFSRTVGELSIRGLELDLQGELLPGWKIIAAYAYTPFARILRDQTVEVDDDDNVIATTPGNTGNRFNNVPHHNASLFTSYAWQTGGLKGLKLGAGVTAISQRQANLENTAQSPGYATVNLLAAYEHKIGNSILRLQLNADNIFDKHYYSSTSGLRFMPGAPRSLRGLVSISF